MLEQEPVSKLCDELRLQPTVFYRWQKEFFENGAAAFQTKARAHHQAEAGPAFGLLQMHVTDPSDLDGYRELIPLGPPRYHYTAPTVADGALRLAFNKTRGGPAPQGNVSELSIDGAPIG